MNMLKNIRKNKGFTLIEILVVIVIIGILTAIISVSVGDVRKKARNAKRLMDIRAYVVAFDMALDKNGEYPDPEDQNQHCLGRYKDDWCGWKIFPVYDYELESYEDILKDFIALPVDEYEIRFDTSFTWKGYVYSCSVRLNNICRRAVIYWSMEGYGQSCGVGTGLATWGAGTYCYYVANF